MSKEKTIDNLKADIIEISADLIDTDELRYYLSEHLAVGLYEKSYHKQVIGEWVSINEKSYRCSICNRLSNESTRYCPNCGSWMK